MNWREKCDWACYCLPVEKFVTLLWLELSRVISGHKEIGVRTKNEKYILKLNCARQNYVIVDLLDFGEG